MSKLYHLVPVEGGKSIPIDKPLVFVGRHADCDIDLTQSRKVSRKHCCVAQINSRIVVRDLGSTNGVKVRGKLIRKETKVEIGDELQIGDCAFKLQLLAVERRGAVPAPATAKPSAPLPPQKRTPPKVDPAMLSQDLPVVISEQMADFVVEETLPPSRPIKRRSVDDDVIELEDDDLT